MAAVDVAAGVGGGLDTLTTGSVSPSGSDRYVFGATCAKDQFASEMRYGGSGGTLLDPLGTNLRFAFDNSTGTAHVTHFDQVPGPTGSTTGYAAFALPRTGAMVIAFLTGVDPTTPVGTQQNSADDQFSFDQVKAASLTVTGLTAGQLVVAIVSAFDLGGGGVTSFTAGNGDTTVHASGVGTIDGADEQGAVAIVSGVAAGSSLTLACNITTAAAGLTCFRMSAFPVNDAGGGGTEHETSGALVADAATMAGTAERDRQHDTSGALVAQAATVAGLAERDRQHNTSGALQAQAATMAGAAERDRQHTASGALVAAAATMAGTAELSSPLHVTSGALQAQAATMAGAADRTHYHDASGALTAQAAGVAGQAERDRQHDTSGALQAQAATMAGAAAHTEAGTHVSEGELVADPATVTGTATLVSRETVLSPKFLGKGHKNVKFKPLREPASQEILQPDVTNIQHVEPPKRSKPMLDMLDEIEAPPPPAPAAPPPPAPAPAPKPKPKAPPAAPAPEPAAPPPPAPAPAPTVDLTPVLESHAALAKQVAALSEALATSNAALQQLLAGQVQAKETREKAVERVDEHAARRARNRVKAEAIVRTLLEE